MLIQYFVSTCTYYGLLRNSFPFCSARVGQITRNTAPIFIRVSYSSLFPRICPDPERWMPFEYLVALNTLQNAWLSKLPRISLNEGQTLKLCYDDNVKFKHRRERKLIRCRGRWIFSSVWFISSCSLCSSGREFYNANSAREINYFSNNGWRFFVVSHGLRFPFFFFCPFLTHERCLARGEYVFYWLSTLASKLALVNERVALYARNETYTRISRGK